MSLKIFKGNLHILPIIIFVFLFFSFALNLNPVFAECTCVGVDCPEPGTELKPGQQSYCVKTQYCYISNRYPYNEICEEQCGCTAYNTPTVECDGIWEDCIDGWQTRGCQDGSTQIRSCGPTPAPSGPGNGGGDPTSTPDSTPRTCTVNLAPKTPSIKEEEYFEVEATVSNISPAGSVVSSVFFFPDNSYIVSVEPDSDASSPYLSTVTGLNYGTTNITAWVIMDEVWLGCEDNFDLIVEEVARAWWQTKDADIITSGNITSRIPSTCSLPVCEPSFDLDGAGGFPGIPFYAGSLNIGSFATISSTEWSANSIIASPKIYNYSFFESRMPTDTEINTIEGNEIDESAFTSDDAVESDGYYWFKYDGGESGLDLTINSDVDIGSRKIVLFSRNHRYISGWEPSARNA